MSPAHAPPSSCASDAQCTVGFFCEVAINFCQACLSCEDLRREAPSSPTSCIKSVADCGPCLQGLMVDHRGGVDVTHSPCVPPDKADVSLPSYIWIIIGLLLLGILIAIVIIFFYVLKRKDLFRISTSTQMAATAPEPPPPYNPYSPMRPDSPDVVYTPQSQESSLPFIKRVPSEHRTGPRDVEGSQNARPFNPPSYVRVDPQSPISPLREDDSEIWPAIHNEDTTPHDWTPDTSTNDDNGNPSGSDAAAAIPEAATSGNNSSDLQSMLATARDTTLVVPPAKKLKTQDSNNNANRGASSNETFDTAGIGLSASHATDAPSIFFNIVQINNTKL